MKTVMCVSLAAMFVAAAGATPYTAYVNDFSTLDGIVITEPLTGPYLAEGGAWGDAPWDFSGYGRMRIYLDPVNQINTQNPLDFTYGDFTIRLQWTSEFYIPDETVTFFFRAYSRQWNETTQQWELAGQQNYAFSVIQGPPGGPPGWQEWIVNVNDWTESQPNYNPEQVYLFVLDAIVWDQSLTPWSWGIEHFELIVPECPRDLDGDDDVDLSDLADLLSDYGCDSVTIDAWYDSMGFESFTLGDLPGQQGFIDMTSDDDPSDPYVVLPPQIIDDPTGSGMGKVIKMDPDHDPGDGEFSGWSGFYKALDAPATSGYFSIAWDQYRTDGGDNVWIADDSSFDTWWAIEWDSSGSGAISTYEWNEFIPLTFNVWQHIQYKYDLDTGIVVLLVDDVVKEYAFADTDGIEGLYMDITDSFVVGDGPIYIDNLRMGALSDWDCPVDYDQNGLTNLADLADLLSVYGCGQ